MHFSIALNTSTLREHRLGLEEEIEIAAASGYQGIEPWMAEIDRWEESGRSLAELRRRLADHGLRVPSVIDFWEWMVDDAARRRQALEAAKRACARLAAIGAEGVAAAPFNVAGPVPFEAAAERYRDLLEVALAQGVTPYLEFWGKSPCLNRLSQVVQVAIEAGHPRAAILADVYHLYKGGSSLGGLGLLAGRLIGCFHFNDYPASPSRQLIEDQHRVYPGDGVAPLAEILRSLQAIGYAGMLSIELFNPTYYAAPPRAVAREAFEKTRQVLARAHTAFTSDQETTSP